MKNINQMQVSERPRERLQLYGALSLSDQELLAILLGSGSSQHPVLALAQQLLKRSGGLPALSQATFEELCAIKGIGPAKATLILAAAETGRRMQHPVAKPVRIISEAAAIKHFQYHFKDLQGLHYLLVLLNRQKELLATSELKLEKQQLPDLQNVLRIANEAGAHSFGLLRNAAKNEAKQQMLEEEWLTDLRAAASMHSIRFYSLLTLPT